MGMSLAATDCLATDPLPQMNLRMGAIWTNSFWKDSLYQPYKNGL
jgi:hypothetical protein